MAGERTKIRILRPKKLKKLWGRDTHTPPPVERGTLPPHTLPPYTLGAFDASILATSQILDPALVGGEHKLAPPPRKYFLPTPLTFVILPLCKTKLTCNGMHRA